MHWSYNKRASKPSPWAWIIESFRDERKGYAYAAGIGRALKASGTVLLILTLWCLSASSVAAQQTFTVTTTADSGDGSLRAALDQANDSPGLDVIEFNIDGGGSYAEIMLESILEVNDPIDIDGNTQGCDLNEGLCIRLDGGAFDESGMRFFPGSDGSTVRGLVFTRFGNDRLSGALSLHSDGHVVQGNYFGTDRTGLVTDPDGTPDTGDELGNANYGITLFDTFEGAETSSRNNRIGGAAAGEANVIGGSTVNGINLSGERVHGNVITGNFIGVGIDGETILGIGMNGIEVTDGAHDNAIGGLGDGEGNMILAAGQVGILIDESPDNQVHGNVISAHVGGGLAIQQNATGNEVVGNRIGTSADGMTALPNGTPEGLPQFAGYGVQMTSGTQSTLVADNQISGNLLAGIIIGGLVPGDVVDNEVWGNLIGLDATGQAVLPNGIPGVAETGAGIVLFGHAGNVRENVIGTPDIPNFIGGNTTAGILIDGPLATANLIQGNTIGLGEDAQTPVPNGQAGILIRNGAHDNLIGGLPLEEAHPNAIVFNPVGIAVAPNAGMGNQFAFNFFGGALLDIDLGLDGPTANDTNDEDEGPNLLQNYADITALDVVEGELSVTFRVDTAPENATYPLYLQLYVAQTLDAVEPPILFPLDSVATYESQEAGTYVTRQFTLSEVDAELDFLQARAVVFDADGNASEMNMVTINVATDDEPDVPLRFALEPNYPNPFNPATQIAYMLPRQAHVHLDVFDIMGRRVAVLVDASQPAGRHEVRFDGAALPSGTYLYRLQAGDFSQWQSMVLLK